MPTCISVVPGAMHEASQGPLKDAVSSKKALQGFETEMRELLRGTEEKSVSPTRGHWFALQANYNDFYLAPLIFDFLRPP